MGVFLDGHTYLEVPLEALRRALRAAEAAEATAREARPIDYIVTGGWIYCVTEAPDPPAVERLHAELGLPRSQVVPVEGADARRPLSQHDRELILQLIG